MDDQRQQTRFNPFRPRKRIKAREVSAEELALHPPPREARLTTEEWVVPSDALAVVPATTDPVTTEPAETIGDGLASHPSDSWEVVVEEIPPDPDGFALAARRGGSNGLGGPGELVLDPTLLGERRRKQAHARRYRLTLLLLVASFAASLASLLWLMMEVIDVGWWLAVGGAVAGGVALPLVRWSRLSSRLRGYAVAAFVLGLLAIVVLWLPGLFREDHPAGGPPLPRAPPAVETHR